MKLKNFFFQSNHEPLGCHSFIHSNNKLHTIFLPPNPPTANVSCRAPKDKHRQGNSFKSPPTQSVIFCIYLFVVLITLNNLFHIGISSGINSNPKSPNFLYWLLGFSQLPHLKTALQHDWVQSCRKRTAGAIRAHLPAGTRFALEANDVCTTVGVMLS